MDIRTKPLDDLRKAKRGLKRPRSALPPPAKAEALPSRNVTISHEVMLCSSFVHQLYEGIPFSCLRADGGGAQAQRASFGAKNTILLKSAPPTFRVSTIRQVSDAAWNYMLE